MHLPPTPPPLKKKKPLQNHCVRFLIGRLLHPGEIGNNGYAKFGGGEGGKQLRCIMIYVKMLNALLEHLLRKTLSYFFLYIFPFFVLTTNICNIRVQPLLICFSLKNANAYECMEKWF